MPKHAQENTLAVLEAQEITTIDKYGNEVVLTLDTGMAIFKAISSMFGKRGGWKKNRKRK